MSDPANKPDEILENAIAETREGNTSGFETIVLQLERPLRSWLATVCPPGIDVDDIAQQSFVQAYTQLEKYQPETNFRAWLFTIAKFQLKTEITRQRRVADYHNRYAPDLLCRELEGQSELSPNDIPERLSHLQHCVSKLENHLQRFLVWRYEEQIPLETMSSRSGRSVAAVKKQLWKIRRVLQECVQRQNATGGSSQ